MSIKIQAGQTLSQIAKQYGVSVKELQQLNGIKNPNKIRAGQTIQIPIIQENTNPDDFGDVFVKTIQPESKVDNNSTPNSKVEENSSNTYIVKSGDTLSKIAKAHGITLNELLKLNPDIDPKKPIHIEDEIVIPCKLTRTQIQDKIKEKVKEYGLNESLVLGLVELESDFNPSARSKTGAVGLFQLTKKGAEQAGGKKTYNIDKNIEYGLKYLKWCIDNTKTEEEALVAYNRGLSAMKKAKEEGKPIDSITDKKNGKGYAENVLELRKKYQSQ